MGIFQMKIFGGMSWRLCCYSVLIDLFSDSYFPFIDNQHMNVNFSHEPTQGPEKLFDSIH